MQCDINIYYHHLLSNEITFSSKRWKWTANWRKNSPLNILNVSSRKPSWRQRNLQSKRAIIIQAYRDTYWAYIKPCPHKGFTQSCHNCFKGILSVVQNTAVTLKMCLKEQNSVISAILHSQVTAYLNLSRVFFQHFHQTI